MPKLYINFNQISIQKILENADKILETAKSDSTYALSYPAFLEYFKDLAKIEEHNLLIAINFTYGWMPRIPNIVFINEKHKNDVLEIVNKVKNKQTSLERSDYENLTNCINKSIVGTSKLLHFINPEEYPIWDSNVCRFFTKFTDNEPTYEQIKSIDNYVKYKDFCQKIVIENEFLDFYKKQKLDITAIRLLEFLMYEKGKSPKKDES